MLDRVGFEPVVNVHHGFELSAIVRAEATEVHRVHQRKQVRVIAGGSLHRAFGERPAVAREFFPAAGGREFLESGPVGREIHRRVVELEPELHFVQVAARFVRPSEYAVAFCSRACPLPRASATCSLR